MVSEGTLYEQIDGALEEPIEGVRSRGRSALSAVTASHSWTFIKLCPKSVNFLLRVVQLVQARERSDENLPCR